MVGLDVRAGGKWGHFGRRKPELMTPGSEFWLRTMVEPSRIHADPVCFQLEPILQKRSQHQPDLAASGLPSAFASVVAVGIHPVRTSENLERVDAMGSLDEKSKRLAVPAW